MEWLVTFHSVWRYVVLITLAGALVLALLAYFGVRDWDGLADRFSLFYTIAIDIQVLIGVLVWVFAFDDRSDVFLTWIHPGIMLVAAGLAHAGRVMSERADGSKAKGGRAALFFAASLLAILIAIPVISWPL